MRHPRTPDPKLPETTEGSSELRVLLGPTVTYGVGGSGGGTALPALSRHTAGQSSRQRPSSLQLVLCWL